MTNATKIIIDNNATICGRGSDRYKWVSGLSKAARDALRNGDDVIVLVPDDNTHPATTAYKQVLRVFGKYTHRNYYGEI